MSMIGKIFPKWLLKELIALKSLGFWLAINSFLLLSIVHVMTIFAGHINKDVLAAAGLGRTFCTFAGIPIALGFVSACDTLCSQAYGAGNYKKIGIVVQRVSLITIILMLPVAALWMNSEKILIALGQNHVVARLASQFTEYYVVGFFFLVLVNILIRYLACQKIVQPLVYALIFGTVVNIVCCYLFMFYFKLGIRGGALGVFMAYLSICLFLLFYLRFAFPQSKSWQGWSWESLDDWKEVLYLGIPSMAMMVVEWSVGEIGILAIGTIGSKAQATQIAVYSLNSIIYFISAGIATAVAVRVGNLLGAGEPTQAKRAMKAAVFIEVTITLITGTAIIASKDVIGWLFTNDRSVLAETSKVVPLIALSQMLDGLTAVLLGVVRGAGLQKYGAILSFLGYVLILLPCIFTFIFVAKLGVPGAWTAMILGWAFQVVSLTVLLLKSDWNLLSEKAKERSAMTQKPSSLIATDDDDDHSGDEIEMNHLIQSKSEGVLNYDNEEEDDVKEKSPLLYQEAEKGERTLSSQSRKRPKTKLVLTKLLIALFSLSVLIAGVCIRVYL